MGKTSLELIELYHDQDKLPDRYYYKMNGKSAQDNYMNIINHRNSEEIKVIVDKVSEQIIDNIIRNELNIK